MSALLAITDKSQAQPESAEPAEGKPHDIAAASVPDTLATLKVNPDTGLTRAEVETRRRKNGFNEVADKKEHPAVAFLGKFWGLSAWMLEVIMALSAVLGNYSDLVLVSGLLVVNAVVSFMQERRAAGLVQVLRKLNAMQAGRSFPLANSTPATSFGCDRETSFRLM